MNVLAIGATGFIGSHVARLLCEQGHTVAVLHREKAGVGFSLDVQHINGSRDALAEVRQDVERFSPDVILDVIPYTEQQAAELMRVFRGLARRVVAVSSADVYRNYDGLRGRSDAPPDPVPLSEDAPLRETRYPYRGAGLPFDWADDYEKILVERAVLSDPDLPGTVLRLPAVYGPGDRYHRIRPYLCQMSAGRRTIFLPEEQFAWRWTRGYVENVAAAIALTVVDDRAAERVYNIGEASARTEQAWVEEIGAAAGWTGAVVRAPADSVPEDLRQPLDFRYELATDTARIREELSYRERIGREEAMRRTVEWERTHAAEME